MPFLVREADVRTAELPMKPSIWSCAAECFHSDRRFCPPGAREDGGGRQTGRMFVQEPDFSLARTTEPDAWARAWAKLIEWGRTQGVDWFIGRRPGSPAATLPAR